MNRVAIVVTAAIGLAITGCNHTSGDARSAIPVSLMDVFKDPGSWNSRWVRLTGTLDDDCYVNVDIPDPNTKMSAAIALNPEHPDCPKALVGKTVVVTGQIDLACMRANDSSTSPSGRMAYCVDVRSWPYLSRAVVTGSETLS